MSVELTEEMLEQVVDQVVEKLSYPGHKGRPGQRGGSAPKGGGGGSPIGNLVKAQNAGVVPPRPGSSEAMWAIANANAEAEKQKAIRRAAPSGLWEFSGRATPEEKAQLKAIGVRQSGHSKINFTKVSPNGDNMNIYSPEQGRWKASFTRPKVGVIIGKSASTPKEAYDSIAPRIEQAMKDGSWDMIGDKGKSTYSDNPNKKKV